MTSKFEQLIEFVINDEEDKAKELFHDIVVEKSREIYENLMNEEEDDEEEDSEEEDPNILGYLTKENIIKGTQLMIFKSPEHFFDLLNDNMDATTADVWFQYVVLGEIVYG